VISDSLSVSFRHNSTGQDSLPPSDSLELLGIVNGDVDTEVHPLLGQVDVKTSDFSVGDPCLHS
jgi:hypothetical protein